MSNNDDKGAIQVERYQTRSTIKHKQALSIAHVSPLGLSDFGLLVSLGHDIGESGARDGSHELLRSPRPLFGSLFDHALAVFATVQHRPVDLDKNGNKYGKVIKKVELQESTPEINTFDSRYHCLICILRISKKTIKTHLRLSFYAN